MKNFIETIKKKDKKITNFFEKKELGKLEKMYAELEEEHQEIRENLKEVNYLLDLIEKHQVEATEQPDKKIKDRNNWLEKIKSTIEKIHVSTTENLSSDDIEFVQKEKSKLLFEKSQLEKEHHHIHQLLAKIDIYMMDARNTVCKEITKGYDIADVGEKLLEHFGNQLNEETDYDSGRKKIMKFLESLFSINKIKARELVDLLEKSSVIYYKTDYSNVITIPDYDDFIEFTSLNYTPLFGTWYINA
ncbi:MAG TPA: hypothetical protein ENK46_07105 [Flavobacteriia bacterium]|nr:hypothetical protein [Flavobacteriia bacterium]